MKFLQRISTSFLLALFVLLFPFASANASSDLIVSCANEGPCSISPSNTPLFEETNIAPGDSFSQTLSIINQDSDDICSPTLDFTESTVSSILADRILVSINDSEGIYFDGTLRSLIDGSAIALNDIAPVSDRDFTFFAEFDSNAGNEYQGLETLFDISIVVSCAGGSFPPSVNPGNSGSGSGSTVSNSSSTPSAPVCTATPPSSAPSVSLLSQTDNTASLSWTSVGGADRYALIFTRNSDGAQYGSPNLGNVTSYTITNLQPGTSYTFQIIPFNDCAAGPAGAAVSAVVTGGVVVGEPTDLAGTPLVLGATDQQPDIDQEGEVQGQTGQVEGITDEVCASWYWYLPWLLLVVQVLLSLLVEYWLRSNHGLSKYFILVGILLGSIGLFYWLRQCDCFGEMTFLAWLCRWYWVVASVLALFTRGIGYGFISQASKPLDSKELDSAPHQD